MSTGAHSAVALAAGMVRAAGGFYLALWWVPAGHLPTVEEAKQRLRRLELAGPGPDAFTFAQVFPPPGGSLPVLDPTLEATCP
jgi:hypothetical protein